MHRWGNLSIPVNPWQHPHAALGADRIEGQKSDLLRLKATQLKVLATGGGMRQETTVSIVYPKLHTCIPLQLFKRQTEGPGHAPEQTLAATLPASRGGGRLRTEKDGK